MPCARRISGRRIVVGWSPNRATYRIVLWSIDPGAAPSRWSDWLLQSAVPVLSWDVLGDVAPKPYAIINLESALERFEFLASPTAQLFYSKASFHHDGLPASGTTVKETNGQRTGGRLRWCPR